MTWSKKNANLVFKSPGGTKFVAVSLQISKTNFCHVFELVLDICRLKATNRNICSSKSANMQNQFKNLTKIEVIWSNQLQIEICSSKSGNIQNQFKNLTKIEAFWSN